MKKMGGEDFTYEHIKTIIDFYRPKSQKINSLPEIQSKDEGLKYLKENFDEIKFLADIEYKNFIKYIKSNINNGQNIAIVDSVSKFFSAQKNIEKTINKKLYGLYYLIQEGADLNNINVDSFSPISKYSLGNYLIEFIMTSNEPPILSISNGQVLYKSMTKEEYTRIQSFEEISRGVIDFVDEQRKIEQNLKYKFFVQPETISDFINNFIQNPTSKDKDMFECIKFAYDVQHSYYHHLYPHWYQCDNTAYKKEKFYKNFFSIKNERLNNKKHKVLTIFGIKIKVKVKDDIPYKKSRIKLFWIFPFIKKLENNEVCKYYLFDLIEIFKKETIKYEL